AIDTAGNTYNMGNTDPAGQVTDALVTASYRFRVTYNGTNFYSGAVGHCAVPGCTSATVTVTLPTTVTVVNGGGVPQAGLQVWWQDGVTTTYVGLTNAAGQVTPSLPGGSYRFRVLYSGTYFYSSLAYSCAVPGCTTSTVVVGTPMTVTVLDDSG